MINRSLKIWFFSVVIVFVLAIIKGLHFGALIGFVVGCTAVPVGSLVGQIVGSIIQYFIKN